MQIDKIITNHNSELDVQVPTIIADSRSDVTWKRYCNPDNNGCGHMRCFSIFPGDSEVCGICISTQDTELVQNAIKRNFETDPKKIYEKNEKSNWVQCKTCCANYGVTSIQNLNVRAKC